MTWCASLVGPGAVQVGQANADGTSVPPTIFVFPCNCRYPGAGAGTGAP